DASHLVVSAGGNNALDYSSMILHEPAGSFAEVLARLAQIRAEFQAEYRAMLQNVLSQGLPTIVCTIYDTVPGFHPAELAGLAQFNEIILKEAVRARVSVVDLRLICTETSDYAPSSPIEPSGPGGGKIARAVTRAIEALSDHTTAGTRIIL
ncbi:SGNH/GDSL hydrolase family protein, partial [Singulisphaera rosea]